MSLPDTPAPQRKRRTIVLLAAAAVVALVVVLSVISLTTGSSRTNGANTTPPASSTGQGSPGATATATPSIQSSSTPANSAPPPVAVPVPAEVQAGVEANVHGFIAAGAKSLAEPAETPSPADFAAIATGSAYDSMIANSQDFQNNGWHQDGAPTVASITITGFEPSATPQQATLAVCVDSSSVNVLTADGVVVRKGTAADRSLNILTMVKPGDSWLVSKTSFPDNAAC